MISIYFNLKSVFDYVGIDLLNPLKVTRNIDSESFLDVFYYIILRVLPLLIPIYLTIFFLRKYLRNKGQRIWVGTENKLFLYKNRIENEYFWKDFNGNIEFELEKKVLILELRKGSMSYNTRIDADKINQESVHYSPEKIQIYEVDNILEVVAICQSRIKQHDPTPLNN